VQVLTVSRCEIVWRFMLRQGWFYQLDALLCFVAPSDASSAASFEHQADSIQI
jgi:hypothetical protein